MAPDTWTGAGAKVVVEPLPSSPAEAAPQQYAAWSVVTPQV